MNATELSAKTDGVCYHDYAINNAGTLLAILSSKSWTTDSTDYPRVYDISGDTPIRLACDTTLSGATKGAFNYDDTKLLLCSSSVPKAYAVNGLSNLNNEPFSANSSGTIATLACSPVVDRYGVVNTTKSGTNYIYHYKQSDGTSFEIGEGKPSNAAYSPDGVQLALACSDNYSLRIFNINGELIADRSVFNALGVNDLSYNLDGSLLAVAYNQAPWVEIYETTNFTKVCDLSDIVSAKSFVKFATGNVLVIGTGTSVIVRTIEGDTHVAYDKNVPEYSANTEVTGIFRNHNGTGFVIGDHEKAVIWMMT